MLHLSYTISNASYVLPLPDHFFRNVSKPVIRLNYLFKSVCITIIFLIFLSKIIYYTSPVFQHEDISRVRPCSDTNANNGGRREMRVF